MSFSFVENEHQVRQYWIDNDVFKKSLALTKDKPQYIAYDGPPFATGKPHHGHLLASTVKDTVHRYFTQRGYYVERRFGWDCHGLPIEHEINKSLGLPAHEAVSKLGISGYNQACRDIVMRYSKEWQGTIERLGRWVDFDNDYKTMDKDFMESVWWVFNQVWEKGLIYEGEKVVPFSTALGTGLSNFEAGSNYQSVQDPAITVLFSLKDDPIDIAIWTTTPWTLPANLAIAISPEHTYQKVKIEGFDRPIIMMSNRVLAVVGKLNYEIIETLQGSELVNKSYLPLFTHDQHSDQCFKIHAADFIDTETGTGLVHMAPAFGEDDYQLCKTNGINSIFCPITDQGTFDQTFSDYEGLYIKDADKLIIKQLKSVKRILTHQTIEHNYPFCPRSDTPLIYKAIPSWFVAVTQITDQLQVANQDIHWVPEHLKEGRFGKWISQARDWAISRNRVWGTPIPLWRNNETNKIICIDSIDTLKKYTNHEPTDLHRDHIDQLTFSIEGEPGVYQRIPEVLDCWFESGAMPYAQQHYPFKNKDSFEETFPAQFIAEGLDQTRGWFYTLNVLSVILFGQPAFKNVIVTGIVVAEDGKKMSKRLRNYTPPDELMAVYGADALRLYLISSNLVKGEEQRFSDEGVKETVRTALLPWYNAFKFFKTYAEIDAWTEEQQVPPSTDLDRWILSKLQTLKERVHDNMAAYKLYLVVPALLEFIEELTNTYIRMNRNRFWGSEASHDKMAAYSTLFKVLDELSKLMAPFSPHLSESIYQDLKAFSMKHHAESVHLCSTPQADNALKNPKLESGVTLMQEIINMARQQRVKANIKTKVPLQSITIVHKDLSVLKTLEPLSDRLRLELNIKEIKYSQAEEQFVRLYAKPNLPQLGKKHGKKLPEIKNKIEQLNEEMILEYERSHTLRVDSQQFDQDDLLIFREILPNVNAASNRFITISLNTELTAELISEGHAREIVSQIQKTRKELNLDVAQRIRLIICAPEDTLDVMKAHQSYILGETLALEWQTFQSQQNHDFIAVKGSFSIIAEN